MKSDDSAWLTDLFGSYSRAVRAFAFRRVAADVVDDVVAEVFLLAWRSRSRVPSDDRVVPWLYRTATNVIGHHYRGSVRRRSYETRSYEARSAEGDSAPDWADTVADQITIVKAMSLLSDQDAEVLRLAYWEDLPASDVGLVLGCSPGAARVRLHRARNHLQQVLADDEEERPVRVAPRRGEEDR